MVRLASQKKVADRRKVNGRMPSALRSPAADAAVHAASCARTDGSTAWPPGHRLA
jgi:hypothetical protein